MKRRKFIEKVGSIGGGAALTSSFSIGKSGPSANSKLNIAMIGCGGACRGSKFLPKDNPAINAASRTRGSRLFGLEPLDRCSPQDALQQDIPSWPLESILELWHREDRRLVLSYCRWGSLDPGFVRTHRCRMC